MRCQTMYALGVASTTLLMGCFASNPASSPSAEQGTALGTSHGGVIVFGQAQFRNRSQDLLSLLRYHMSNMRVHNALPCPEVILRGRTSIEGSSDPKIFVDGQRAANTCILEALNTLDLEQVEIYPMGITTRPGYPTGANGLILIFMKRPDQIGPDSNLQRARWGQAQ